jgi:2-methylisocitrate lyase-like PEP mutase family enzyme
MDDQRTRTERFRALHEGPEPLLIPNAWDAGSAAVLASLGFAAIATTSSGHAATLGRLDGAVTREEALAHGAALVSASGLPVSADLENGFADEPGAVGETVELAIGAELSGCSIEDWSGEAIYPFELAVERVAAAADAAHRGAVQLVLTARAENHIRGRDDLDDTIARLQAFEAVGADVLYAPGLIELADIRRVVESVGKPVNVLARPGVASVAELGAVGVRRVSVGGAFAFAALGALVEAAEELRTSGTYGFISRAVTGGQAARTAFGA